MCVSNDVRFLIYRARLEELFVNLGHFLPFYPLKMPKIKILKNQKFAGDIIILHMCTKWCTVPDIESETGRTFCHLGSFFTLLPTPKTPKIKILKNQKLCCRYHHFTHVCQMMYGSWYMEWDRQNFLSCWVIFCPFNNPTPTPPLMT